MVNVMAADAVLDPSPGGHEADDPLDAWLLALADASGADWLVTGEARWPRGCAIWPSAASATGRQQPQ